MCNCETVEFMHMRCIPPFKKFSSKYKRRRHKQMTNFHEFQHTFMSPNQQPGVPSRVCRLVGAISGGRFYDPLFRARATHHITSHQTSDREESGVRRRRSRHFYVTITRSCEYKCKKATVWPRYPESTSCQCWDPLI